MKNINYEVQRSIAQHIGHDEWRIIWCWPKGMIINNVNQHIDNNVSASVRNHVRERQLWTPMAIRVVVNSIFERGTQRGTFNINFELIAPRP